VGKIIGVQPPAKHLAGKEPEQVRQGEYSLFSIGLKERPVAKVFFRPEESHGRSGIACILTPLGKWNSYISDYLLWLGLQEHSISNFHMNGFAAIKTGGVNFYLFTREKPADRQRFKRSLAKPFLLTVDSDAKLGGKIVKGCERSDEIRTGGKPSGYSLGKKLMKDISALLHGDAQFFRYFRIMGSLPGFHHTLHNEMKGFIQVTNVHGLTS